MRACALAIALVALCGPARAADRLPREQVLAEGWLFQPDPLRVGDEQHWERADLDRSGWRSVVVPMAWDHYETVMDGYEGVGWYALELPAARVVEGAWQRLSFGRANHRATVWIDGQRAGENLTGYLPFEVPASPFLHAGRSAWIVVRVENGVRPDWLPGATVVEWVQYGGLLEPVELVTTERAYIAHVSIRARPRGTEGAVEALVELTSAYEAPLDGRVRLEIGGLVAEQQVRVVPGSVARVLLALTLPEVRRWSLDSPALYDARVRLARGERELDAVVERFGVRSIEAKGRQILLNGAPLAIRGVNRYDEFPGRGPVVDEATLRRDLEAVKAAGANLVRTHYPQSPAHLALADELGLLFMEELPLNWWRATFRPPLPREFQNDRIVDLCERVLEGMVRRDGNHPSLVIWSVANECLTSDELGTDAMSRLLERAHELDPTRLATYVANQRFQQQAAFAHADLVAVNLYFGMWDGEVARDLSEIDGRVYEPTRAALAQLLELFPDRPVLLSEFGTIGIPGSGGDVRFSEDYQAAYVSAIWRALEAVPDVAGGIVWSWADYRHRAGFTNDFPAAFGPFGLVTLDRKPKKALDALRALWTAPRR